MHDARKLLHGLKTAVQIDGLPNRWLCTELSNHCELSPMAIEELIRRRKGVVINMVPCHIELTQEGDCTWVDVEPFALHELCA